jgi:hypothetical protein
VEVRLKISFEEFSQLLEGCPVIIQSLDQALYQVLVVRQGMECLLLENGGKPFRRHSLNAVRECLRSMPITSLVLRQQSAYDEMIGQPPREGSNALEVPLSLETYPGVTTH